MAAMAVFILSASISSVTFLMVRCIAPSNSAE